MSLRETRRFLFRAYKDTGGHIEVAVRAGTARHDALPDGTETGDILGGTRALSGVLTLRPEEWADLRRIAEAAEIEGIEVEVLDDREHVG